MKDPAFLFYSSDFLTGVADLTFEERGQYITLLCLQHQKGHLSKKVIDMNCAGVTKDVMSKFQQDSDGLFYHPRLELEANKRKSHAEKQRERAVSGWKKRKKDNEIISHGNATASATAMPLENDNENEIENRDLDAKVELLESRKNRKLSKEITTGLNEDFVTYIQCCLENDSGIALTEDYAKKKNCFFGLIKQLPSFQRLIKNIRTDEETTNKYLVEFLRYNSSELAEVKKWHTLAEMQQHAYNFVKSKYNQDVNRKNSNSEIRANGTFGKL